MLPIYIASVKDLIIQKYSLRGRRPKGRERGKTSAQSAGGSLILTFLPPFLRPATQAKVLHSINLIVHKQQFSSNSLVPRAFFPQAREKAFGTRLLFSGLLLYHLDDYIR